jgi:hypothetical protein
VTPARCFGRGESNLRQMGEARIFGGKLCHGSQAYQMGRTECSGTLLKHEDPLNWDDDNARTFLRDLANH